MTVLLLGDVKSRFSEIVSRVHDHHERVTVTVHGRPSAVLVAPEDLELIVSNIGLTSDFSAIYTSNSGQHTAFVQANLKEGHHTANSSLAPS